MMTQPQFNLLKQLARQYLTCIELAPEVTSRKIDLGKTPGVRLVQTLTKLGYARDYGDQRGRRVEVRLRIWGITDAGRAVLQQQSLAENKITGDTGGQSQLALTLAQKPDKVLSGQKGVSRQIWIRPITTNQLAELGRQRKASNIPTTPSILKIDAGKETRNEKESHKKNGKGKTAEKNLF